MADVNRPSDEKCLCEGAALRNPNPLCQKHGNGAGGMLTSKKCSHPENRRGFDTGIEWCIDCQAIMDDKGNFVHQTAEATDAPQVLSASAECPLCGHEGPHPHTPLEQVIYHNGVKAGKAHGNETFVGQCDEQLTLNGTLLRCVKSADHKLCNHQPATQKALEQRCPVKDDIRDLACCDVFTRESASEFCATCGYTNLDHLRKRSSQGKGE